MEDLPSLFCDSSVPPPLASCPVLPVPWDDRDQLVLLSRPGWAQTPAVTSALNRACRSPRPQPRDHSPGCWEHWTRGHVRWAWHVVAVQRALAPNPTWLAPVLSLDVGVRWRNARRPQVTELGRTHGGCPWGRRHPLPHVTHRARDLGDRLHPGGTGQQEEGVSLSGGRAQLSREGEEERDRGPGTATRGTEQASWRHMERSLQRQPWGRNRIPGPGQGGRRGWVGVITDLCRGEEDWFAAAWAGIPACNEAHSSKVSPRVSDLPRKSPAAGKKCAWLVLACSSRLPAACFCQDQACGDGRGGAGPEPGQSRAFTRHRAVEITEPVSDCDWGYL